MSASQAVFNADLARFDEAFRKAGAIYTLWLEDEGRDAEFIDTAKVHPDLMRAWRNFTSYGYANGLMP